MLGIYENSISDERGLRARKLLDSLADTPFYPEEVSYFENRLFFSGFHKGISCILEEHTENFYSVNIRKGYYPPRNILSSTVAEIEEVKGILLDTQGFYDNTLEEMHSRISSLLCKEGLGETQKNAQDIIREKAFRLSEGFFSHGHFFVTACLFQRTFFAPYSVSAGEDHVFPYFLHMHYASDSLTEKKNLIVEITEEGANYYPCALSHEYENGPQAYEVPQELDYFSSVSFLER
jgi:hypothetical protein